MSIHPITTQKQIVLWSLFIIQLGIIVFLLFRIFDMLRNRNHLQSDYVAELKKEHYAVAPTFRFHHFYEPVPNEFVLDNPSWLGHRVTYTINSDSLNAQRDYDPMKPDGVFRIVLLGDSFTFGLFVNTFENYAEALEDILNDSVCSERGFVEVLNLGVPGYDAGYSMERFRKRGFKYDPDLVIWFMNHSTMTFLADYKLDLEEKYASEMSLEEITAHEKKGEFWYPGILAYEEMLRSIPKSEIIYKEYSYITELGSYYRKPLVFVANNWSFWSPQSKLLLERYLLERPDTWIHASLPSLEDAGGLLADKHPNPTGHQLIADSIANYLIINNIINCPR